MTNLADEMKEQFNQHKQLIQDMDNKLLDFNNKITHLEDQLKNTTNSIREKDCLPLELSDLCRDIYKSFEEISWKFDERFDSQDNVFVTRKIITEVEDATAEHDKATIKRAAHRYFDTLRRKQKEITEMNPEEYQLLDSQRHVSSRRSKLLKRRQKAAKKIQLTDEEKYFIEMALPEVMSDEESDEEDPNILLLRKPKWRCKEAEDLYDKLDQVAKSNGRPRKPRVLSEPSGRRASIKVPLEFFDEENKIIYDNPLRPIR